MAFHGVDHSGRSLGVVTTDPLRLDTTIQLGTIPAGPNGVAVAARPGLDPLVAVTNRQTDELVMVAPPNIHRRFPVGDMPDGVIGAGTATCTPPTSAATVSRSSI